MMNKFSISERRACRVTSVPIATVRYKSRSNDNEGLLQCMLELSKKHPRYGHRRLHSLLLMKGYKVNHKKTARLYYKVLQLQLRKKKRTKKLNPRVNPLQRRPTKSNEILAMDFVSDQLMDGRRIRCLTVIDTFSRFCHVVEFDTSITSEGVIRLLDNQCSLVGYPSAITVDNGPEFTSKVLRSWASKHRVELLYSRPGTPTDNPFIESFNGKFRDEFLNANCFISLSEARSMAEAWKREYNYERPHSAIGMIAPSEFLKHKCGVNILDLIA